MKIAVYAIALNEAQNAEQFMRASAAADLVVVGDTGSTDDTVEIIKDMGGSVVPIRITPWRFDAARNAVLSLLPANMDLCIKLDFDEKTPTHWRSTVENAWDTGIHDRLRVRYVHNFNPDGSIGTVGTKDVGHTRFNYHWQHAVHEKAYYVGIGEETVCELPQLAFTHHPDTTKSRATYIPLLEYECQPTKSIARHLFWLGREYSFAEEWDNVVTCLSKYLKHKNEWKVERARAMCFMGDALVQLKKPAQAFNMYMEAVNLCPEERINWLSLAIYHQGKRQWSQAYAAIMQCLAITVKPAHYLVSRAAWQPDVHELAARYATWLAMPEVANRHTATAKSLREPK